MALGAFFGIIGAALCLIPYEEGLFLTRLQAGSAVVLLVVCAAFIIVVFKRVHH